jgi:type I restriction enzyme M protein
VILLPENLFYNTTAAGVIIVLNKRKPKGRKGQIVLLNASQRFTKGRPKNYLTDQDRRALADLFNRGEPVESEVAVITREQAEAEDYNLSPSKWVGAAASTSGASITELIGGLSALSEKDTRLTQSLLDLLRPLREVRL